MVWSYNLDGPDESTISKWKTKEETQHLRPKLEHYITHGGLGETALALGALAIIAGSNSDNPTTIHWVVADVFWDSATSRNERLGYHLPQDLYQMGCTLYETASALLESTQAYSFMQLLAPILTHAQPTAENHEQQKEYWNRRFFSSEDDGSTTIEPSDRSEISGIERKESPNFEFARMKHGLAGDERSALCAIPRAHRSKSSLVSDAKAQTKREGWTETQPQSMEEPNMHDSTKLASSIKRSSRWTSIFSSLPCCT